MSDLPKYPKQVFWSDEDEGFIAIAPDLLGCSAFGETEVSALAELDDAIEAWIDTAKAVGNAVPAPSQPALRKEYSGKLLVRMPQSLHQELATAAKREEVSLNHFIVFVLSRYWLIMGNVSAVTGTVNLKAGNPVMLVGTTAITAQVGMTITTGSLRPTAESLSWPESLGKRSVFYGKVHDEVSGHIIKFDTFAIRSTSG